MHSPSRPKIVTFGDSTTAPRDGLLVYAEQLETALATQGIEVSVINAGVPGNDTAMAAERFERDVLALRPAVAILQFGINDSSIDVWKDPPATKPRVPRETYRANLQSFIDRLQGCGATVILMTPNQQRWTAILLQYYGKPPYDTDDPLGLTRLLGEYAAIVRDLATENRLTLADVYSEYDRHEKESGVGCQTLLLDGSHPNQTGQDLVVQLLMRVLPDMLRPV